MDKHFRDLKVLAIIIIVLQLVSISMSFFGITSETLQEAQLYEEEEE